MSVFTSSSVFKVNIHHVLLKSSKFKYAENWWRTASQRLQDQSHFTVSLLYNSWKMFLKYVSHCQAGITHKAVVRLRCFTKLSPVHIFYIKMNLLTRVASRLQETIISFLCQAAGKNKVLVWNYYFVSKGIWNVQQLNEVASPLLLYCLNISTQVLHLVFFFQLIEDSQLKRSSQLHRTHPCCIKKKVHHC